MIENSSKITPNYSPTLFTYFPQLKQPRLRTSIWEKKKFFTTNIIKQWKLIQILTVPVLLQELTNKWVLSNCCMIGPDSRLWGGRQWGKSRLVRDGVFYLIFILMCC